jgi:hypothetical protein
MSTILIIPDLHIPYHHEDSFKFLAAVAKKYDPDHVVNLGDEVDKHGLSFHDSDPDLPSAGDELKLAKKYLKKLYKLFPEMDLVDSNHGSLAYRKAKAMGMPQAYIRDYNDVLDAPPGWVWHDELILSDGRTEIMIRHQFKKNPLICAQQMGMCVIQGHFHENFDLQYVSSPNKLIWAMTVGCLIDKKSLAFTYNKTNYKRPILGCSIIVDGQPQLIPMYLNKQGRWTGVLR